MPLRGQIANFFISSGGRNFDKELFFISLIYYLYDLISDFANIVFFGESQLDVFVRGYRYLFDGLGHAL